MLRWLKDKRDLQHTARALYGSSVAGSRREVFFRDLGVPDTIAGRFEMLVLHLFLVLDRLKAQGPRRKELSSRVADELFLSLDDAMREMGVGDLTVPKKMHKAAGAFYGRLEAYAAALAAADEKPIEDALRRNVYGGEAVAAEKVARLAGYVRRAQAALETDGVLDLDRGEVRFPDIEEVRA
jgi:cytochrome b pre-mRNA-processing protein 3